jgi:glycerol-3-phosphate acyltransferase PlsY
MPNSDQALNNVALLTALPALSLIYISALLAGYLIGSIPFGIVFTRLAGLGDLRNIGSGNIGATNVLRTGRKDIAAATLIFDVLKGTFAVLLARMWGMDVAVIAALGVFIGHLYPVWLKFKGGKGVATYLGIVLGFSLSGFIIFAACWLCVAWITRFSSLAAILASLVTPLALLVLGNGALALLLGALSCFLIWRHRENIHRLLKGEESKIELST